MFIHQHLGKRSNLPRYVAEYRKLADELNSDRLLSTGAFEMIEEIRGGLSAAWLDYPTPA